MSAAAVPPIEDFYGLKVWRLVGYTLRERPSFLLMCLYLMVEYVRPQTVWPAINVVPWGQVTLGLAMAALLLEGRLLRVGGRISFWLLAYCAVAIFSSFFAYRPEESLAHWSDLFFWVVIYFLIVSIVDTERRFLIYLILFLLFSFKMADHAFLSWALRGFSFRKWGVVGAPGWFHNSGEFGIQMCVFVPLSLYFAAGLWNHWGKWKRLFFAAFPAIGALSIVATSSRGAMLGAGVVGLWFVWQSRHRMKALVLVVLLGATMLALLPEEFAQRFENAGDDRTSQTRLSRWKDGAQILADHPLTGIGYGNWQAYYTTHYYHELGVGLSHNITVDVGAELGLPGLVCFFMLIVQTYRHNRRSVETGKRIGNPLLQAAGLGLNGALVGYLVSAQFVSVLYYPYFWINLAFTAALAHVAGQLEEAHRKAASANAAANSATAAATGYAPAG